MSAPAATYSFTRLTVRAMPSRAIASVRALTMKSESVLAFNAASILSVISRDSISSLPRI